ncbi:MAG: shikimate dehydrogenase [Myxococcales bacterium]|nr:shikimate dehydrogenase [Myxococcales bacterium]
MSLRYGILGHPVAHSLSPAMQTAAFRERGIDATYAKLPVKPEDLQKRLPEIVAEGFAGLNVTVPHKEAILPLLDHVDGVARAIGAVNTISIRNGALFGTNTDAPGLVRSLEEAQVSLQGIRAVILGAGGAARAAVVGLAGAGAAEIVLLARDTKRAKKVADELQARCGTTTLRTGSLTDDAASFFTDAGVVIQATSATMEKSAEAVPFAMGLPWGALPPGAAVCDLVYVPVETPVLNAARARDLKVIDGLGMLLHQGALAFETWTGKPAPTAVMREALLSSLA